MKSHVDTLHTGAVRMRKGDRVGQKFLKRIVVSEDEKTAVKASLQKDLKRRDGARGTQTTTVVVRGKRKGGAKGGGTKGPVDNSGASSECIDGDSDDEDVDREEKEEEHVKEEEEEEEKEEEEEEEEEGK